jgi:hypothetical protein
MPFGTRANLGREGGNRLRFTPPEGEGRVCDVPRTDIERAELAAFAAAVAAGPAYPPLPEEAIHGVAVFEAMIGAAASGAGPTRSRGRAGRRRDARRERSGGRLSPVRAAGDVAPGSLRPSAICPRQQA